MSSKPGIWIGEAGRQSGKQIEALVKEPVMDAAKSWFCTSVTGIRTAFSMGVTSSFNDTKDSVLFRFF